MQDEGYRRAFLIEYRLSQGAPLERRGAFPAALLDVIAGYSYLVNVLQFQPQNILVSGESSGGNLALALARYINRYPQRRLRMPHALLLLHPTVDLANTNIGQDSSMRRNEDSDYAASFFDGYPTRALLGFLPLEAAATDSWISPGSLRLPVTKGLFTGFPPTCILAGDCEMTLDGSKTLRDRLAEDNGADNITYFQVQDCGHAVIAHEWEEPQRSQACELVAEWVGRVGVSHRQVVLFGG